MAQPPVEGGGVWKLIKKQSSRTHQYCSFFGGTSSFLIHVAVSRAGQYTVPAGVVSLVKMRPTILSACLLSWLATFPRGDTPLGILCHKWAVLQRRWGGRWSASIHGPCFLWDHMLNEASAASGLGGTGGGGGPSGHSSNVWFKVSLPHPRHSFQKVQMPTPVYCLGTAPSLQPGAWNSRGFIYFSWSGPSFFHITAKFVDGRFLRSVWLRRLESCT